MSIYMHCFNTNAVAPSLMTERVLLQKLLMSLRSTFLGAPEPDVFIKSSLIYVVHILVSLPCQLPCTLILYSSDVVFFQRSLLFLFHHHLIGIIKVIFVTLQSNPTLQKTKMQRIQCFPVQTVPLGVSYNELFC